MSVLDLENSRLPRFSWLLHLTRRLGRITSTRRPRPMDIRELSPHLLKDIGWH